jgi:hypothetical protein
LMLELTVNSKIMWECSVDVHVSDIEVLNICKALGQQELFWMII